MRAATIGLLVLTLVGCSTSESAALSDREIRRAIETMRADRLAIPLLRGTTIDDEGQDTDFATVCARELQGLIMDRVGMPLVVSVEATSNGYGNVVSFVYLHAGRLKQMTPLQQKTAIDLAIVYAHRTTTTRSAWHCVHDTNDRPLRIASTAEARILAFELGL